MWNYSKYNQKHTLFNVGCNGDSQPLRVNLNLFTFKDLLQLQFLSNSYVHFFVISSNHNLH